MSTYNAAELTETNFDEEVVESPLPVLVDFWGEGCGPCKMLAPVLDELALEYTGRAKIAKIKIEDHSGIANRFRITALPTVMLFKNGQPIEQTIGLRSKRYYKASLDRAIT